MTEPAIYIQGDATDTLYFNPVPTPSTTPVSEGDSPSTFGIIYVSTGDLLSPNVDHPYYRLPNNGATFDLLQAAAIAQATFITVVNEPILPFSRNLTVTTDLSLVDGGAQNPIQIGLSAANIARLALIDTATFITVVNEPGLPQSRRLTVTTRLTLTDGGAQGPINIEVDAATDALLTATALALLALASASFVTVNDDSADFPASRQITAGTGITIVDGGVGGPITINSDLVESFTVALLFFACTPAPLGTNPTPVVGPIAWVLSKIGNQVTVRFDTFLGIDGGTLGLILVMAPAGSIPVGFRPAVFPTEIPARFSGAFADITTWRMFPDGSVIAAAIPSVVQFTAGPGKGWIGTSMSWLAA